MFVGRSSAQHCTVSYSVCYSLCWETDLCFSKQRPPVLYVNFWRFFRKVAFWQFYWQLNLCWFSKEWILESFGDKLKKCFITLLCFDNILTVLNLLESKIKKVWFQDFFSTSDKVRQQFSFKTIFTLSSIWSEIFISLKWIEQALDLVLMIIRNFVKVKMGRRFLFPNKAHFIETTDFHNNCFLQ